MNEFHVEMSTSPYNGMQSSMFRLVNLLSLNGTIKNCTVAHSRQITKAYYMLTHACIHALFIR